MPNESPHAPVPSFLRNRRLLKGGETLRVNVESMKVQNVPKPLQELADAINMMAGGRNITKEDADRWDGFEVDKMDFRAKVHVYATGAYAKHLILNVLSCLLT